MVAMFSGRTMAATPRRTMAAMLAGRHCYITSPDGGDVTPVTPQYRADIGAYLGNQWMARATCKCRPSTTEGSQYRSADGSVWMRLRPVCRIAGG